MIFSGIAEKSGGITGKNWEDSFKFTCMEVFGVENGLAVKKRIYTVKYRKTTVP